ncbi:MAG TPA: hypothetical protein VH161_00870 [Candidatus Acidoferrales bacterium]|jgi:hypothetical protein|nr:hypothetical protein [Candidatus Acidoferrales bacterium]
MRGRKLFRVLKVVAIATVTFTVFGFVVTYLWNYLMPGLFGLRMITFWQAVGLMVLGRLLFGGFRPGRGSFGWRGEMMRRWEQMTPEEREKFREGMRGRCGAPRAPEPAANH